MKLQQVLFATLLISVLITCIAYSIFAATVRYADSDSKGSLLLSQAIIQQGTVKLDSYSNVMQEYVHRVHMKNNHVYYYFPIGTPLYSAPFVAIANIFGQDMRVQEEEARLQIELAAFLGVTTFLLLFFIAKILTGGLISSSLLAALFWFGSGFCSTSGTALWSQNWASLYSLLAIALVIQSLMKASNPRWCLIGFFLFSAYLCRPTLALLSPIMIILLYTFNRMAAFKVAAVVFTMLAFFVFWSLYEFRQPLPDYYLPKRLGGADFGEALAGNLFSPARGLFVYMPFLIVPFLFWRRSVWVFRNHKKLMLVLVWPLIHLVNISRFPHWWGGYSYGPRLMIDIIPALFIFYCLFTKDLRAKSAATGFIVAFGLLAIYINWYQGLFNMYTKEWNAQPNIDKNKQYLWNWHFTQFLYNEDRHNQRNLRFQSNKIEPISPGQTLGFQSHNVTFNGLYFTNPPIGRSHGNASEIRFRINQSDMYHGELRLRTGFFDPQKILVWLNGEKIATFEGTGTAVVDYIAQFEPSLLTTSGINAIRLEYSNARVPSREVIRFPFVIQFPWAIQIPLAIRFESITVN